MNHQKPIEPFKKKEPLGLERTMLCERTIPDMSEPVMQRANWPLRCESEPNHLNGTVQKE